MPKHKRGGNLSSAESKRRKMKEQRRNETAEEREVRLISIQESKKKWKETLTDEQKEEIKETKRMRMSRKRRRETSEEKESTNKQNKVTVRKVREKQQLQAREQNFSVREVRRRRCKDYNLKDEAFHYDPLKEYNQYKHVIIGKMDQVCKFCSAKKFSNETPGMCCMNGKIRLPPLEAPPPELLRYMTGETPDSKHFLQNMRGYNACFQMTSFGATYMNSQENQFSPVFSIKGQIYHKMGSLLPLPNENHKFLQVYFIVDEKTEVDQRCANISGLRRDIIENLQKILHKFNQLIHLFKTALDRMISDDYKVVIRADKRPVGEHERRFNAKQINEIAIVIVDNEYSSRDIIVQRRKEGLQRISETHRSYDALQYPLIFIRGEDGYHFNLKQVNPETGVETNKKITSKEFYAYRLMIRDNEEYNHILNSRHLFQQYLVDMYAKVEAERMLFIRQNQKKLRTEEYIHLRDAIMNESNVDDIGKLVILPSSHIGSPRHMHEYAQDIMTYVRKYGRPHLFITCTCNPAWLEIKENLIYGQTPMDRHDIIARVFRQKLIKVMDVIVKYHIFEPVRCWMYTIEWQKRGLPHAHILIWLTERIHPNQIDEIIRAEIPNPEEDPELYNTIVKHMIHGPCGSLNKNSPCMKEGKCTKRYPRPFLNETQTGDDGYPKYRRLSPENGGFTAKIKIRGNQEIEIDNRWVVPYNPLLSKMFQAHINVEYCNSVKSIKYVCKYVNKGSDMAVFAITNQNSEEYKTEEILQYQMGRYINTDEGAWRIFGFPIHEREPAVVHLAVHLENGQRVYFTKETAKKVGSEPPLNTTLTAFFQLCKSDSFARTLLYADVPSYFTWNTTKRIFQRRKQGTRITGYEGIFKSDALGVYTVHPKNSECFYLRMLLHEIRGPTCFADLKTINGYVCETYKEACQRLGLLENDNHWELTLQEAALSATAEQIRDLFSIILTTCSPSNPQNRWEKFKETMCDDIVSVATS